MFINLNNCVHERQLKILLLEYNFFQYARLFVYNMYVNCESKTKKFGINARDNGTSVNWDRGERGGWPLTKCRTALCRPCSTLAGGTIHAQIQIYIHYCRFALIILEQRPYLLSAMYNIIVTRQKLSKVQF